MSSFVPIRWVNACDSTDVNDICVFMMFQRQQFSFYNISRHDFKIGKKLESRISHYYLNFLLTSYKAAVAHRNDILVENSPSTKRKSVF